jgi:alpha-galactosidase
VKLLTALLLLGGTIFAQPPRIVGPGVVGARPGHPFVFRIPTTGARPMHFHAPNLPGGLKLDRKQGIISGTTPPEGEYRLQLQADSSTGTSRRTLRLVASPRLALTPPMGWSTWYSAYDNISDAWVRQQADALVKTGLADHGYAYINIDDGWNRKPGAAPARDSRGNVLPNDKFPDMKSLTAYIHSLGLRAGIYTSPGPTTCAGYEGSYGHEEQDAKQYAAWGFDFLKYDWCSYGKIAKGKTREDYVKPYRLMGGILQQLPRDLVFNLCQYGMGDVWEWGREVGGNFWRTTGDISLASFKPDEVYKSMEKIGFSQAGKDRWAGPGGWNDPDNILLGQILVGGKLTPTPLDREEQKTYFTLWSFLAAPLVLGGDLTRMDAATLEILTNDEIIAINQDQRGQQATPVLRRGGIEVWVKALRDGEKAAAVFNRTDAPASIPLDAQEFGWRGAFQLRDLWAHKNLGRIETVYKVEVPRHGVVALRASH